MWREVPFVPCQGIVAFRCYCRIKQIQDSVQQYYVLVSRNDIKVIQLEFQVIAYLNNRYGGNSLEQFNHHILVCQIKMLNNHKSHTATERNILQENLKRLQPSG